VATKVAGVDAPLGIDVTAPLVFTVIVVDTSRRLAYRWSDWQVALWSSSDASCDL